MFLTDVPEEVIIIIVKKLDLKSLKNLYDSSEFFKRILSLPGVIREWQMSLSSMSTVQTFKTPMFRDVAGHLQEVHMCGVIDLCKTAILPALRRLKCLKTLDVSYTDIDILDFFDMYDACPTIRNICINFAFEKTSFRIPETLILRGQKIFEKMENVHFVGSTNNLLFSDISRYILQKAYLNTLKYTIIHKPSFGTVDCDGKYEDIIKFKQLYVYFMHLEMTYGTFRDVPIFKKYYSKYEIIIISNGVLLKQIKVYVTSVFKDFFRDKFGIDAKDLNEYNNELAGNMGIMIFNRTNMSFDEIFFAKLFNKLRDCFPVFFDSDTMSPITDQFNWFYTTPSVLPNDTDEVVPQDRIQFKKKRVAKPSFTLDYDDVFKNKTRIKLSIEFTVNYVNPVALDPNSDYLSKITFLSLSGTIRFCAEFFQNVFQCCKQLETLDIVAPSLTPCVSTITRGLPLCKTLKNLRLIDRKFDFNVFFQSLSQCKTIENIHILDRSTENTNLAQPNSFFKNCPNLYSVCIQASMSNETQRKMTRIFNNAKKSLKMYQLNIKLRQFSMTNDRDGINYEPYVDVFNIYPIKPGLAFL